MKSMRFRRRRRPATPVSKPLSLSIRDWVALTISSLAFGLSGITTYMNVVRTTDDLAIIVERVPDPVLTEGYSLSFEDPQVTLVIRNGGSRPASILSINAVYAPVTPHKGDAVYACSDMALDQNFGTVVNTDFVPQTIAGGQISVVRMNLLQPHSFKIFPSGKKPQENEDGDAVFDIAACLRIRFSTPSVAQGITVLIGTWSAFGPSPFNPGPGLNVKARILPERQPVELYRHSGSIFKN